LRTGGNANATHMTHEIFRGRTPILSSTRATLPARVSHSRTPNFLFRHGRRLFRRRLCAARNAAGCRACSSISVLVDVKWTRMFALRQISAKACDALNLEGCGTNSLYQNTLCATALRTFRGAATYLLRYLASSTSTTISLPLPSRRSARSPYLTASYKTPAAGTAGHRRKRHLACRWQTILHRLGRDATRAPRYLTIVAYHARGQAGADAALVWTGRFSLPATRTPQLHFCQQCWLYSDLRGSFHDAEPSLRCVIRPLAWRICEYAYSIPVETTAAGACCHLIC